MRRFILFMLAITLASPASAARFEFVDPSGFLYRYSGVAGNSLCLPVFCSDPGPLWIRELAGLDVVGAAVQLLPTSGVGYGWAVAGTGTAQYSTIGDLVIAPDAGESIGDPITIYVHSKAYLEGTANADVFHNVFVNSVQVWSFRYEAALNPGWTSQTIPLEVQIGDEVLFQSNGIAPDDPAAAGSVADGLLQISFSSVPPPNPPIALPLGGTVAWWISAAMGALGFAWLRRTSLSGRS